MPEIIKRSSALTTRTQLMPNSAPKFAAPSIGHVRSRPTPPTRNLSDLRTPSLCIHLLRHGPAGQRSKWHGNDADRPLSERGRTQVRCVSRALRDAAFRPTWRSQAHVPAPLRRLRSCQRHTGCLNLRRSNEGSSRDPRSTSSLRSRALIVRSKLF